jgi:hypothetical protein
MYRKRERTTRINRRPLARFDSRLPYQRRRGLLSPGERRFFHEGLRPAVGDRYLISFKVRLADVITVDDWEGKYGRKIAQKHLDFVLVTPKTTRVVAAIELNDASHDMADREQRDAFVADALRVAGIPLVTLPIYRQYNPQKIRQRILTAIKAFRR